MVSRAALQQFTYHGKSMSPTFRDGDQLLVDPHKQLHKGDIIVYPSAQDTHHTVHRIIACHANSIITRGDNNPLHDDTSPNYSEITGKVVAAYRNQKALTILNGWQGLLYAKTLHTAKQYTPKFSRLLHLPYHVLAKSLICRPLQILLTPYLKTASYTKPRGTELHLLLGKTIIAKKDAGSTTWKIRKPCRLIIHPTHISNRNR